MKKNYLATIVLLCLFVFKSIAQPVTSAPVPPTKATANVISLFSDAYTNIGGINWFPGWGQTTVVSDTVIAGNATKKYSNFNYEGVQFTGSVDASSMDSIHIDIWTPDCTAFDVFLINTSPATVEQSVRVTPTLSGWSSFNIALSQYTNIALANIGQLKLVSTPFGGTTVYLDNIYFFKSSSGPTITGFNVPAKFMGDAPFTLTAPTSNSTGAFTYSSSNTSVATISGNQVTIKGVGNSIIKANQAAAGSYGAGSVSATLSVTFPPPAIAAPIPPVRIPANYISLYSNAYTNITGIDWAPGWGQTTVVTDLTIAGDSTKKFSNFNYEGVQFTGVVDASAMNYLHLDIWTADCTTFDVYLINQTTAIEQKVSFTPTLLGWNSFDIPLSQYNLIALNNIGQMKFVGTNASEVYLDNIYFFYNKGTAPVISITAPLNNATYNAPANIVINATATSTTAIISKVEFFKGGTSLGVSTVAPYSINWSNVSGGNYSITAKATDSTGLSTTSSPVSVIVAGPSGDGYCGTAVSLDYEYKAETVGGNVTFTMHPLSPILGSTYALFYIRIGTSGAYAGYNMTSTGSDFTYTMAIPAATVVSFYFTYQVPSGGEHNSSANPHSYTVGDNCTGINSLPTINITNPLNNSSYMEPANIVVNAIATDANGPITKVEFFNGSTLLATSTTPPYGFNWNNIPAGNYTITAKLTDSAALTAYSSAIKVVVNIDNSKGFCGTIASGEYSYRVEQINGQTVITFHPLTPIAGCAYAFVYVRQGLTGTYPGYAMTPVGADFRYALTIPNGTPLSIYFTYQVPGGEHNSSATPHSATVGVSCLPLPVNLISFKATMQNAEKVILNWTTTNEQNNAYYVIEKSNDGIGYIQMNKIIAKGNTYLNEYVSYDNNPSADLNYYKLTQYDIEGYSKILGVEVVNNGISNSTFTIFPNPIKGKDFTINLKDNTRKSSALRLFDLTGKLVFSNNLNISGNNIKVSLPVKPSLGIYLFKLEGFVPVKLVVQ